MDKCYGENPPVYTLCSDLEKKIDDGTKVKIRFEIKPSLKILPWSEEL